MRHEALIVWGGWPGHEPEKNASVFAELLTEIGLHVKIETSLDALLDAPNMPDLRLIVPIWTMGEISHEQVMAVWNAVASGVGLAGSHGGMGDAFRACTEWSFIVGTQFVSHPGDRVPYTVSLCRDLHHPITEGLADFEMNSEQYYLHVDPAAAVLATTEFPNPAGPGPHSGNRCRMPQALIKSFGAGRVFYTAIGHEPEVFESGTPRELMKRGFDWAAQR